MVGHANLYLSLTQSVLLIRLIQCTLENYSTCNPASDDDKVLPATPRIMPDLYNSGPGMHLEARESGSAALSYHLLLFDPTPLYLVPELQHMHSL